MYKVSTKSVLDELDSIESYSPTVPKSWKDYHEMIRALGKRCLELEELCGKTTRLLVNAEQNIEIAKYNGGWVVRGIKKTVWFYNPIQKVWSLVFTESAQNEFIIEDFLVAYNVAKEVPPIE